MNITSSYTDETVSALTSAGRTRAVQRTYESGERFYILRDAIGGRGNVELPSVTSIISRVLGNPFPEEAAPYLEHARARGIEVHRSIAMLSRGVELDWDTVHHEVEPRLRCFQDWGRKENWTPEHVETAFVSFQHGFAGTPDQVGYFSEGSATLDEIADPYTFVVDFKPPSAWFVRLQLAFYAIAVKESLRLDRLPRRMPVYLHDDKPAVYPALDRSARDRDRALSVMNVYNIGIEEGVWA